MGFAIAVVVGVGFQVDLDVVFPGGAVGAVRQFVRAVADGVAAERGHVPKGHVRQRVERAVSQPQREVDGRRLEPHVELEIVDHSQPGHGGPGRLPVFSQAGDLVVPDDRAEKALLQLGVGAQRPVIPRVDERMGRHRRAVGELPAGLEDDPVGDVVGGLDRLRHLRRGCAGGVVGHQTGEQPIQDPPAEAVVGGGRNQRVGRFTAVDDHRLGGQRSAAAARRRTDRQHEGGGQEQHPRPTHDTRP